MGIVLIVLGLSYQLKGAKMVTIHESNPPITDADIQALEQQLNIKFPDDYRRFLLAHNGGRPKPEVFLIPDHSIPNQSSILD